MDQSCFSEQEKFVYEGYKGRNTNVTEPVEVKPLYFLYIKSNESGDNIIQNYKDSYRLPGMEPFINNQNALAP